MFFRGASSVPFFFKLFFDWAFSDFGWFPNLVMETFEASLFIDTFDPTFGKLIWELFLFACCDVGLPVDECDGERACCLAASTTSPGFNLDSLCRPLPYEGTLLFG